MMPGGGGEKRERGGEGGEGKREREEGRGEREREREEGRGERESDSKLKCQLERNKLLPSSTVRKKFL